MSFLQNATTNTCDNTNLLEAKNNIDRTQLTKCNVSKKLVIKNFVKPQLSGDFLPQTWEKLREAVISIQNSKPAGTSLEELYQAVQNLCSNQMASTVYMKLRELTDNHVSTVVLQFLHPNYDNLTFLKMTEKCWENFCNQMIMIRCIFLYLDRTYVLQHAQISSIWDMGVEIFREQVIFNNSVKLKITESILDIISKERNGEKIDRMLLKNILRMLTDLAIYNDLFETKFLKESQQFYHMEGEKNIQEMSIAGYLCYIDRRMNEENERLASYLDHSTSKRLIHIVERELIQLHMETIFKTNFDKLFSESDHELLKLAYNLLTRVPEGTNKLCSQFNSFIKNQGKQIVISTEEKDKTMVQELLDFKDKVDEIAIKCFGRNEKFINSLKEAFEYFINQRTNKPAELIAKFVDIKLRSGNKETTEEEFEKLLDKVMVIFRFIHGKDIFEAFYKKDLAKRLLVGKSASVDAEKSMLLKLKQECGSGFTSKLEGMFKDMELSRELMPTFKQFLLNTNPSATVDMSVSILTTGYWPTYHPVEIIMPSELLQYEVDFNRFYTSKHGGRKLQWQRNLGNFVLKATFNSGVKELQVSFFQGLVLLLFNSTNELSLSEIRNQISDPKKALDEPELRRTLQSLACGKARVLIKNPKGRDINDHDKFTFCGEFTNKLFRIKINQIQMKETKEENTNTQERVFQDRQYQIDAAVVRIMKMRKKLQHNLLLSEIFKQIKFPATPAEMKKRIESLIERDYVQRDKDQPNLYHYVA